MKFLLEFKRGLQTIAKVEGISFNPTDITVYDMMRVINMEQTIERMVGPRVHFSLVVENDRDAEFLNNHPYLTKKERK